MSEKKNKFKVLLVYANSPMDNLIPVGVSSLAGALKEASFQVRVFDTTFYPWTGEAGGERKGSLQVADFSYDKVGVKFFTSDVYEDFRKTVLEYKPDLIGVSTVEPTYRFSLKLLYSIQDLKVPTIAGGVFTIFSPDDVINEDAIDMVCVGEGEECLVKLCIEMSKNKDPQEIGKNDFRNIENLWFKKEGQIIKNKNSIITDLEDLPLLNFELFDEKRYYRPMSGHMYRMVPVEFSRGCPYQCSYCSAPSFANKFRESGKWLRYKPLKKIIDELKAYVEKYNIEYFYFVSETFLSMPMEFLTEFCREYKKILIPFWFNTRPETITSKKIQMLEDIGCHRVSVGVESGNEEYRRKILKRYMSNKQIIEACNIISGSKIQLSVNNIIGFPDEDRKMIFDTIYVNRQIDADSYSCSIFQPYRGTGLYDYCVKKGYLDPSFLCPDLTYASSLKQPSITAEDIKGLYRVFPLYVKFPETDFEIISRAEKFDEEGNRIFDELSQKYRKYYKKTAITKNEKNNL